MKSAIQFLTNLTQQRDLLLILVFVTILLMMILPLPTWMMDLMITINISASIMILLMALHLNTPVQFSTFPSLLLVTTLFRLAISISTTRLILIEGDAGQIVETFGNVVVGGNLVVGIIIFMIITVVQFLVITKGADRVAEVGARFTLDGMPGKQMAVDADVRAGNLDQIDAKVARQDLEREAKLFGAMDGAMKFVKGDSVAGLVITAINLIGGIAIGMSSFGYSFSEALSLYALMTIGDGLVSQIPALLISVAAGTIVTRVTNPNGVDLGTEISQQFSRNHRTVVIAGVVIAAFGFIPGFPTVIFLIVGLSFSGGTLLNMRKSRKLSEAMDADWFGVQANRLHWCNDRELRTGKATTVELILPEMILQTDPYEFLSEFDSVNQSIARDFGVPVGAWKFTLSEGDEFLIKVKGETLKKGKYDPDVLFVKSNASYLGALDILYTEHFGTSEGCIVPISEEEKLRDHTIPCWTARDFMMMELKTTVIMNLEKFLGFQSTSDMLGDVARSSPALVSALQEALSVGQISSVMQHLVEERIPITSKVSILEAILEWGPKDPNPFVVLQHARNAIGDFLTNRFAPNNFLSVLVVAPTLESYIREGFRNADDQNFLVLDSQISKLIVQQAKQMTSELYVRGKHPVILTQQDIRRAVHSVLDEHGLYVPVLSYQEVSPRTVIYPIGFLGMEDEQRAA